MSKLRMFFSKHFLSILLLCSVVVLASCNMDGMSKDLQRTAARMNDPRNCFACQLFSALFGTIATLTSNLYTNICTLALYILAIALFIWILWHVLVFVTTLREPNIAQFWITLLQTLFKGGFVAILIATKERLYELIRTLLEPIALIFIQTSYALLEGTASMQGQDVHTLYPIQSTPGFPTKMGELLVNLIYKITVTLNVGHILGVKLMTSTDTDFLNFCIGFVTTIIFFMMTLFFPFYLLDALFRLAFVFALLPFFLVAWVFKKTESYLTKAWAIFMGAFAQILTACIFVSLCIATLNGFVTLNGYEELLDNTVTDIDAFAEFEGDQLLYPFLSFLFIAFYMYGLSKRISYVTSHFTAAPASNMVHKAIDRIKSAVKTVALLSIAVAALAVPGLSGVSKVALDKAKSESKKAADPRRG